MKTSSQLSVDLIEHFYRGVLDREEYSRTIDELVAPDALVHYVPYGGNGADLLKQIWQTLHSAFDDLHFEVEQVLVQDDCVAVRGATSGIHAGPFAGHEPTGRRLTERAHVFYRVADGRIREVWPMVDRAALLRELES